MTLTPLQRAFLKYDQQSDQLKEVAKRWILRSSLEDNMKLISEVFEKKHQTGPIDSIEVMVSVLASIGWGVVNHAIVEQLNQDQNTKSE